MADRLEFRGKLSGILDLAKSQNDSIRLEEVEQYFEEDHLSQEQMHLVCEYLMSQKISVTGYSRREGTAREKAADSEPAALSDQEQAYVEEYLENIRHMKSQSAEEERLAALLPKVVEAAVSLHHPDVGAGYVYL